MKAFQTRALNGSSMVFVVATIATLALASRSPSAAPRAPSAQSGNSSAAHTQTLQQYCYGCHNERTKSGNLVLANFDVARVAQDAPVWEKVIKKLRGRVMPPPGMPRPDAAGYERLIAYLETEMDRAAAAEPDPGESPAFHRLNRAEYQNAIRDLLDLHIDAAEYLPGDDAAGGFDNLADNLRMSPTLVERYLTASEKISRLAVGIAPPPTEATFTVKEDVQQTVRVEGLPFGTRGGLRAPYTFPVDAEYVIKVDLRRSGQSSPLEILLDGRVVKAFDKLQLQARDAGGGEGGGSAEVRLPVKAGRREVAATFVVSPESAGYPVVVRRTVETASGQVLGTRIHSLTIVGPFNVTGPGDTASRRRIFVCRPMTPSQEEPCAQRIMVELATRAFRRPVRDADVAILLKAYEDGRTSGEFEYGIQQAVRQLLVSPEFLFRIEQAGPVQRPVGPDGRMVTTRTEPVSDLELASRLSFFVWSSMPDAALVGAATTSTLRQPGRLERHVRRMLHDERSTALIDNFVGQWLSARSVAEMGRPVEVFPDFDGTLREAFVTETQLFFRSIVREDRSVLDLLTADYTFVNERLARHYGIPGVQGSHFRRVSLANTARRGIFGEGTLLAVTSQPNRTSPVLRGKWIMENILGTPPPPPPANVPPLKDDEGAGKRKLPMRERMAAHRKNPVCASCHSMMDPLGFALENFDAVGRWRDVDAEFQPIDTSGTLPDGSAFKTVGQFRELLLKQPENFVLTLTEKLMTYALGRVTDYRDMPAIRKIVRDSAAGGYRFSAIVSGIVGSVPFQRRRAQS